MVLESSSFDNLLPAENAADDDDDRRDSLVAEGELWYVYDTCQRLSASFSADEDEDVDGDERPPVEEDEHAYPCSDDVPSSVPPSPPDKWPQRPMLLRPSPGCGMQIRGVRRSSSRAYVPLPGALHCSGCTLPINNGLEGKGECLVIDFESDLFAGTAMLRIENAKPPLPPSAEDETTDPTTSSYFDGRKRTFQGVVRGRFKEPTSMSECVTGQVFDRPAGNLPPRIVTKGAISIVGRLAPQLQARIEGDCPRFLSPLVSTAQSAARRLVDGGGGGDGADGLADESLEDEMCEPQPSDPASLLQELHRGSDDGAPLPPDADSVATRRKRRKKAFDKLHASRSDTPAFDPNVEYTFEFFQHMILFDEFALNFPRPIGRHPLRGMLRGQPLKFMAARQTKETARGRKAEERLRWLWSFDLWHESLYEDATSFSR